MNLPIFKILEDITDLELLEVALVKEPAIEEDFLFFNQEKEYKFSLQEEKRIVTGPALIPDKLIYRNSNGRERMIYFTKESIRKFASLFLKNGMKVNKNHTSQHIEVEVLESYLAKKDNEFNVPEGSWMLSFRVLEDIMWESIKKGDFKGFSIQGKLKEELIQMNTEKTKMKDLREKLLSVIDNLFQEGDTPVKLQEDEEHTPEVEEVEDTTPDELKEVKEMLMTLMERIEELQNRIKVLEGSVEEFGKQELPERVEKEKGIKGEEVKLTTNPALKYFN